jgi:hypothetical protein
LLYIFLIHAAFVLKSYIIYLLMVFGSDFIFNASGTL